MNVLSDVDEDNFDRAFSFLRPVNQGAGDVGARLSEAEFHKSRDFCVNLFNPTSAEHHERLNGMAPKEVLDVTAPLVDPGMWQKALSECDSIGFTSKKSSLETEESTKEMQLILDKINASRVVHSEYANIRLETESLDGYVVRLGRGKLGIAKAEPSTCLTREADWNSSPQSNV